MSRKKIDLNQLRELRRRRNLNQGDFWHRFGVTQSGGSRYECGRPIPKPLALLIALWYAGKVSDDDIAQAHKQLGLPARKDPFEDF